jgi:hypothetical protein
MASRQPRNPLYFLLLIAGVVFVATCLAYAIIPILEQRAIDAGEPPPVSPFREALRANGWRWILGEVALLILLALASMFLDKQRTLPPGDGQVTIERPAEEKPTP